ncbi:MAG: hypothetical protein V1766_00925 [Pseudomonadota bacterium]
METSKDDLWNQAKKLDQEKAAYLKQLADQEAEMARMNKGLSNQQAEITHQQAEITKANKKIAEFSNIIGDLSIKIKQIQEAGQKRDPVNTIHAPSVESWGTIMYADAKTNIREKRSIDSKRRGFLMPRQTVKADFLENNWYAVFEITETVRSEKKALGYVYAPRLFKTSLPEAAVIAETKRSPTAVDRTAQGIFSVVVKSIRYKVLPGGKEALLIEFDRFYMPAVYYIEGDNPVIVMEVTRTSSMKEEWSEMHTEGTLIRKIRATQNPTADILRIVLDMAPTRNYDVKPVLYPDDKIYAIEVAGVPL